MSRPIRRDFHSNVPAPEPALKPQDRRAPKPPPSPAPSLNAIRAPYNFVPLADWVHFPTWSGAASHDLPFSDGIGGTVEFTLTADTPLLVSRELELGEKRFMQAPDGRYVIPGSTLRGMVRNVLEIATFGKMGLIDDCLLGVRDLSGGLPAYAKTMTERSGRAFRARAETGWLCFEDGVWRVYPCRHSRVEHDDLAALLDSDAAKRFKEFVQGKLDDSQRTAEAKYRKWQELGGELDIRFEPGPIRDHHHSRGNLLRYSKAAEVGRGSRRGRLVLTGQPSPRKHMEFLFYGAAPQAVEPDKEVMRGFLKIHEDSRDWASWRSRHWRTGEDIPVFYIAEEGRILSLGLAQMFKLPYRLSIRDALRNSSGDHLAGRPDFAETLFGYAGSDGGRTGGLKSRVSFGAAFAAEARPGEPVTVVLNSPKPSYYPNYIRQPTAACGNKLASECRGYTTLMDQDAELRGWKRYPSKPFVPPECVAPSKVSSTLHPLEAGARFVGKLRFHNLKPEELGALVWTLTWNGDHNLAHQLGMGKPLGYGQVRITLGAADLVRNDPAAPPTDAHALLHRCVQAFCAHMERVCRERQEEDGWRYSRQVIALLTMADPQVGEGRDLAHMSLDHQSRRNDFVEAKRRENYFVLEDYEP